MREGFEVHVLARLGEKGLKFSTRESPSFKRDPPHLQPVATGGGWKHITGVPRS